MTAALTARDRIVLGPEGDARFVDLDPSRQRVAVGSTMDLRSLCGSSQAALYEPIPSFPWSCKADMPLECVATRCAAMNHVRGGGCVACGIAPAATEVRRPHPAQSNVQGLVSSFQPFFA